MKMKLGNAKKLENLSYNNYQALLKKHLPPLEQELEPVDYILVAGEQLSWKENPQSAEQPLFYVGNTKDWVKWAKGNKSITLKDYCYGQCRLSIEGDKATVQLLPEKGQLAKPQSLKPLEKIFKRMKPKVFFEVVEEFDSAPLTPSSSPNIDPATEELAKTLLLRHKQFSALQQKIEKSEANGEGAAVIKLAADRRRLLSAIRQLLTQWKTEILETELPISVSPTLQQGQKLYDYWNKRLNKGSAASAAQKSTPPDQAFQTQEKEYYEQALADMETYQADFNGKNPPSTISNHLNTFAKDIEAWEKATQTAGQKDSENLIAIKKELQKAISSWASLEPLYSNWWDKKVALENNYTQEGYEALLEANKNIQEFAKTI